MAESKVTISLFAKDKTAKAFRSISKRVNEMKATLAKGLAIGAKAAAIGGGIGLLAMEKSIAAASEYQEALGKFETVFKTQSDAVKQWSETFAAGVGMSRTEALKYTSAMQDLLVPMGMAREQATEVSKGVVTLAADLGSFNNMPTADVMRDIQSAITGSAETMKKYGVVINQAKINQELINMGIEGGTKAATDAQKAQATLNLIYAGTTDAQGDAERTAGSFANTMKRLWATVDNVAVSVGQKLLPYIQPLVDGLGKWIAANEGVVASTFGEWVEKTSNKIQEWASDGTFSEWWETAKTAVAGVELAMAGLQSAVDGVIADYFQLIALKKQLEYRAADQSDDATTSRLIKEWDQAESQRDFYNNRASSRVTSATDAFMDQAGDAAASGLRAESRRRGKEMAAAVRQATDDAVNDVKAGMAQELREGSNRRAATAAAGGA